MYILCIVYKRGRILNGKFFKFFCFCLVVILFLHLLMLSSRWALLLLVLYIQICFIYLLKYNKLYKRYYFLYYITLQLDAQSFKAKRGVARQKSQYGDLMGRWTSACSTTLTIAIWKTVGLPAKGNVSERVIVSIVFNLLQKKKKILNYKNNCDCAVEDMDDNEKVHPRFNPWGNNQPTRPPVIMINNQNPLNNEKTKFIKSIEQLKIFLLRVIQDYTNTICKEAPKLCSNNDSAPKWNRVADKCNMK